MDEKRPLDIVFISSPDTGDTGDFVYRVRQPGRAMAASGRARVVTTSAICALRDELVERADVLVIDMVGDADLVRTVANRKGPTIYEMSDNIFDIQAFIGLYNAQDPSADLAAPFGAFNIFDIHAYIGLYNQGCP